MQSAPCNSSFRLAMKIVLWKLYWRRWTRCGSSLGLYTLACLHAAHLFSGQGPCTFTLNSEKEIFGHPIAELVLEVALCWQFNNKTVQCPLIRKDNSFDICTLGKAKPVVLEKNSALSGQIMKKISLTVLCEVKSPFPVLSISVLWPTSRDCNRFQIPHKVLTYFESKIWYKH